MAHVDPLPSLSFEESCRSTSELTGAVRRPLGRPVRCGARHTECFEESSVVFVQFSVRDPHIDLVVREIGLGQLDLANCLFEQVLPKRVGFGHEFQDLRVQTLSVRLLVCAQAGLRDTRYVIRLRIDVPGLRANVLFELLLLARLIDGIHETDHREHNSNDAESV